MQALNQNMVLTLSNGTVSTDMSQALTSNAIAMDDCISFCVQTYYSGTPAGTLTLQSANRILPGNLPPTASTDWAYVDETNVAAAGTTAWNFSVRGMKWIRFTWTPSGGSSGVLSAIVNLQPGS